MMAAATAAAKGKAVLLIEKNSSLGKKLRITGGGRCNVTNNQPVVREMLSNYKGKGKFLFSTFTQHGVKESISWFNEKGVGLKEENEGRLFPDTDSAETIHKAMVHELIKKKVTTLSSDAVRTITRRNKTGVFAVTVNSGTTYICTKCIIATGGTSRPDTGSTGDGFTWAKKLGHTVATHNVALVPVMTKEKWVKEVSGISLPNIAMTICIDGVKAFTEKGKVLFTHTGLSGPTILNMSKRIGECLESGEVQIRIDLLPKHDLGETRNLLTELFKSQSNKLVKNALSELIPNGLVKIILKKCNVDEDTPCHSVRVEEKKKIANELKYLTLTITGLLGTDKAVISSGGVVLEEINFKTMESKLVPGLYLVGDMLDIDRPSGGYSLQLCWSTGFVAGNNA